MYNKHLVNVTYFFFPMKYFILGGLLPKRFLNMFRKSIMLILGRGRERKTSIERKTPIGCFLHAPPDQGSNPKSGHVPRLGIGQATFGAQDNTSHLSHTSKGNITYFNDDASMT